MLYQLRKSAELKTGTWRKRWSRRKTPINQKTILLAKIIGPPKNVVLETPPPEPSCECEPGLEKLRPLEPSCECEPGKSPKLQPPEPSRECDPAAPVRIYTVSLELRRPSTNITRDSLRWHYPAKDRSRRDKDQSPSSTRELSSVYSLPFDTTPSYTHRLCQGRSQTTIGNGLATHQSQNNKKGKAASMGAFIQFPSAEPVARPTPWIIKRQVQ